MAPKPRTLPAAALTLAAAPAEFWAAPVPVGEPETRAVPVAVLPLPAAPEPLAAGLDVWIWTVVLLFALTTTVWVVLKREPVPGRRSVWTPGPTAGMLAGSGCEVTIAGWLGIRVTTDGWPGMKVTTDG